MFTPFEIINNITETETIAVGNAIREINRLRKSYGSGRWRKMKGKATIRFSDGSTNKAKQHITSIVIEDYPKAKLGLTYDNTKF